MDNQNEFNLERQRFELEQKRLDQDKELKLKELAISTKQTIGSQWIIPVSIAIIGGVIGLITNIVASQQTLQLEREKRAGSLIVEAIRTGGDAKATAANLVFLFNADLISLQEKQVKQLKQLAGDNPLPSSPPSAGQVQLTSDIENQGFKAILSGDLGKARKLFESAYKSYPTYHNVDEIYHKVLTDKTINDYQAADPGKKKEIQLEVMQQVLESYSWGMPANLYDDMRDKVRLALKS